MDDDDGGVGGRVGDGDDDDSHCHLNSLLKSLSPLDWWAVAHFWNTFNNNQQLSPFPLTKTSRVSLPLASFVNLHFHHLEQNYVNCLLLSLATVLC